MGWTIDWGREALGIATHLETGATFHISRSGWIGLRDAAELSEDRLKNLLAELRTLLDQVSSVVTPSTRRVH